MTDKPNHALLTDLYELTMMQGYYFADTPKEAVFDMFFRKPPFDGGYTIFAGLDPLLDAVAGIRFGDEELTYLDSLGIFKEDFLRCLANFKFTGDIHAVGEGSVVFPNEPILRLHADILQAQLLESLVLNFINFQSLIATKGARVKNAANGDAILEFGLRRAHGVDGALSASRAAFIGGAAATSNVLAGKRYHIPVRGTMAHGWIMNFPSELEAFEKYAQLYPHNCVLLVDTYDTLKSGIPNAIKVFKDLKRKGFDHLGIRLDSGDLDYLSKKARKRFDENGLPEVKIYVSNELDEWVIAQLKKDGAPIDSWGVGTRLVTGDKDPSLSGVYKIAAREEQGTFLPCIKISDNPAKTSNPGIKNILRFYSRKHRMKADLVYLEEEEGEIREKIKNREPLRLNHPDIGYSYFDLETYDPDNVKKLLQPVMVGGKRLKESLPLQKIQQFAAEEMARLSPSHKRLLNPHIYRVSLSENLKRLKLEMIHKNLP